MPEERKPSASEGRRNHLSGLEATLLLSSWPKLAACRVSRPRAKASQLRAKTSLAAERTSERSGADAGAGASPFTKLWLLELGFFFDRKRRKI